MNLRRVAAGALPVAVLLLGVPAAPAQDGQDTYSFSFTTAKKKSAAGFNAEGEFPRKRIIDEITLTLPAGTKIDRRAVRQCTANTADIEAKGVAGACPAASKVGTGKGIAYLGDGADPITFGLGLYNADLGGGILDITLNGKTAFASPVKVSANKLTFDLSRSKELNARITGFELAVKKAGTATKPYLRTPATCPSSRKLLAKISAREADKGPATTSDTTLCKR